MRVQLQGVQITTRNMATSVASPRDRPVTAAQVHAALTGIANSLDRDTQDLTRGYFAGVSGAVTNAARNGGIPPGGRPIKSPEQRRLGKQHRVEVEARRGYRNIVSD